MENKEIITTLKEIVGKTAKTGRQFYSVVTSEGNFTCFETTIVEELRKHLGKAVKLEIAEDEKGFRNLRKFLGETNEAIVRAPEAVNEIAEARKAKDTSIYTSYAKDLFIAFINAPNRTEQDVSKIMAGAIAVIKQAKEAFK